MTLLAVENDCRPKFPSLKDGYIFADNAGGSQCLKDVADRIYDYLINTNVQLGADYSVSVTATTRTMVDGPTSTMKLVNASSKDEIFFGSASTMLVENLARAIEGDVLDGEELVVSFADHETNIGPWVRLAERRGVTLVPWHARLPDSNASTKNPFAVALQLSDLDSLITSKTRLVSFTACSNILGQLMDLKAVIAHIRALAKAKGARKIEVCVDCVAYAPHRQIDVRAWDVDYVFFSYYKVYGPHTSIMYARQASLDNSLTSLAHYFLKGYQLSPGGVGYELTYGCTGVLPYFVQLGGGDITAGKEMEHLKVSFNRIAAHEQLLMEPLIAFLLSQYKAGVRIVGPESDRSSIRAPTISFIVVGEDGETKRLQSKDVVAKFDALGDIGIRYGHFYSYRLLSGLPKMDPNDGIIRISLVHYNTVQEVERIIDVLKTVLSTEALSKDT
ncbi:hypothetical protein FRB96_007292 [Tulasnella sp. 330]|nr:hypothetical protein FRB96_007292 [Tulasnella sp. 330]KAG8883874.1 hypothetical protein FRB97_005712 [Tulasnella sp. 331]